MAALYSVILSWSSKLGFVKAILRKALPHNSLHLHGCGIYKKVLLFK